MLPLNNKPGRLDLFRKDLERLNNLRDGNNRIFALNSYLNFELAQLHLLGMKLKDLKDNIMKRAEDDRIRLKEKWPENPRLCNNSLFGPLGLRSNLTLKEVPLTNALAWLITPHKGSQMHAEMLIALIELSLPSVNKISLADIYDWKVNAEHLTEISEDDRGRIDIYINGKIESNIYQIAIEAKVGAIEGKNQLDKYEKYMINRAAKIREKINNFTTVIFLTPTGRSSKSLHSAISISYADLLKKWLPILEKNSQDPSEIFVRLLFADIARDLADMHIGDQLTCSNGGLPRYVGIESMQLSKENNNE